MRIACGFLHQTFTNNLFRKFGDVIMGLRRISSLKRETTLTAQECVGNKNMLELNKIIMIDVHRYVNMDGIKNNVSKKETSHKRERKLINMEKNT